MIPRQTSQIQVLEHVKLQRRKNLMASYIFQQHEVTYRISWVEPTRRIGD